MSNLTVTSANFYAYGRDEVTFNKGEFTDYDLRNFIASIYREEKDVDIYEVLYTVEGDDDSHVLILSRFVDMVYPLSNKEIVDRLEGHKKGMIEDLKRKLQLALSDNKEAANRIRFLESNPNRILETVLRKRIELLEIENRNLKYDSVAYDIGYKKGEKATREKYEEKIIQIKNVHSEIVSKMNRDQRLAYNGHTAETIHRIYEGIDQ